MTKETQALRTEILRKQTILDKAKLQLKKEFVGIDSVIDEVITSVSSWYLFPDLQEKPVIVNLWGLTGTGKSSLINRLVKLLDSENIYFRFDLGEKGNSVSIRNVIEEIYENDNGFPVILSFDEFQHARTIDGNGEEMDTTDSPRIIWDLLDSGKFQISKHSYAIEEIHKTALKLEYLLRNNVKMSKGKVTSRKAYYVKEMFSGDDYLNDDFKLDLSDVKIMSRSDCETIYELLKPKFKTSFAVQEKLMKFNGEQTVDFLYEVLEYAISPKTVDCSKSIIFVVGNLDEAYRMSKNYNPDLNADEFHKLSLKITVPDIKLALQRRFRNEQIARLGNNHIIYPAFSRDSFYSIIDMELDKISTKIKTSQQIHLEFDSSIKELIYKEGVYPTQGTRPVFTTIGHVVNSKLAKMITSMLISKIEADTVEFKYLDEEVILTYFLNEKQTHRIVEPQKLKLENLRKNTLDDMQAITAVHESGHAICAVFLMNTLPEVIFSTTAEAGTSGFMFTKYEWSYVSRKEITNRIAVLLGGRVAEELVFGKENVTTGAESDIESATEFISEMMKSSGMGAVPATYQQGSTATNYYVYDYQNKLNNEIQQWILKAVRLAEETLKKQETLLLQMAGYLSNNRAMKKERIAEYCSTHGVAYSANDIITNGGHLFYRNHLKKRLNELNKQDEKHLSDSFSFSVNNQLKKGE